MRYIQEVEDLNSLRTLVVQDLKDLGIKAPKWKKNKGKDEVPEPGEQGIFGCHLDRLPCLLVEGCGFVPKFLINAAAFLEQHIDAEGLFRKSGSVARQKELREKIEVGQEWTDANPLDMASLMKQFFRELPEPLLTARLHDVFIKCYSLENESQRIISLLLLCLMLPWQHLCALRFIMIFLGNVASHCENNKMDVANLAVCLAPNFIHNHGGKGDKMSGNESKMLEVQRSIIEVLIANAESIGMVSDSLYSRVQLLSSFPASEDELDRSCDQLDDTDSGNTKTGKKKKRRSGSLQGLVSNLSSSFSKWRRDSKGHNQSNMSDRSTMISMMSDQVDSSIISGESDTYDGLSIEAQNIMLAEATPKLMRKRKASNEMMPFSATKKKAILQQMPHMSALGNTPFTPMTKSRVRGHEFSLDTPSIRFTEGGSHMVFNATPGPTPRKNMEKLLSPSSTTKVKRTPSGKSGCFSPKTPKMKRRGVKGFLRRISGSKEIQPNPSNGVADSEDAAARLAGEGDGHTQRPPLSPGQKKKSSLFRRHRKTPSSPARLVKDGQVAAGGSGQEDPRMSALNQESMSNLQLALQLQKDLNVVSPPQDVAVRNKHKRGLSCEAGIKRGKPNTVSTGLPSERYQPSPNRSRRSMDGSALGPPRHSSQRDIFGTPEKHVPLDCDAGVIDTSPIPTAEPLVHDLSPLLMHDDDEDDEDDEDDDTESDSELSAGDESPVSMSSADLSAQLSRKPSTASMQSTCLSEHDQAFILDCTALGEGDDAGKSGEKPACSEQVFKKPGTLATGPIPGKESDIMNDDKAQDATEDSSVSHSSPDKETHHAKAESPSDSSCSLPRKALSSSLSTESIDSAIDTQERRELQTSTSVNSLKSCDSGLGEERASPCPPETTTNSQHTSFLKENLDSVGLQKTTVERRCGADPKLQVSADMHHRLCKVGVVSDSNPAAFKSVSEQGEVATTQPSTGKVATSVSQFDSSRKELADKHTSPLRFPNSVSRRHGASPVRIPTIFAKADAEAEKYKELVKSNVSMRPPSPKPSRARPILPISTSLLRSVEDAKQKLGEWSGDASKPGLDGPDGLGKVPLKDSTNTDTDTATPHIKPLLLTQKFRPVTKSTAGITLSRPGEQTNRRCRSPIKPVKRLQGSPKSPLSPGSPRSKVKSPKRVSGGGKSLSNLSPIPNHVSNWDF